MGAIEDPQPGDTVVFYYAPSGGHDPGFYGWAVITEWLSGEQDEMYFRPVAPSDHLKMHPWWDADAQALADQIRGKVKQGTFWRVAEDLSATLRQGITRWASGYLSPQLAAGRTAAKPEARA